MKKQFRNDLVRSVHTQSNGLLPETLCRYVSVDSVIYTNIGKKYVYSISISIQDSNGPK